MAWWSGIVAKASAEELADHNGLARRASVPSLVEKRAQAAIKSDGATGEVQTALPSPREKFGARPETRVHGGL